MHQCEEIVISQPTQGEIDMGTDQDEIVCGCEEVQDCE